METETFAEDKFTDLKGIILDECKENDAPVLDLIKGNNDNNELCLSNNPSGSSINTNSEGGEPKKRKKYIDIEVN